jgi:hypothetical protein
VRGGAVGVAGQAEDLRDRREEHALSGFIASAAIARQGSAVTGPAQLSRVE